MRWDNYPRIKIAPPRPAPNVGDKWLLAALILVTVALFLAALAVTL